MNTTDLLVPEGPEQAVTLPAGHNVIEVKARDHRRVSVLAGGILRVTESSGRPSTLFHLPPGDYTVKTDGILEAVTTRAISSPLLAGASPAWQLRLSPDAPDKHVVDGVGEVPADGASFCTITVEKVALAGGAPDSAGADEIFLRTTGGSLMDAEGVERVRAVKLVSGRATFRLVSDTSPRLVTVSAFGQDPRLLRIQLPIELIDAPPPPQNGPARRVKPQAPGKSGSGPRR